MSQRIVNWLAAGAVLATAGAAFGYPIVGQQIVDVTAPVVGVAGVGTDEVIGPRSQFTISVAANATLAAAAAVTEVRLVALNAAGVELGGFVLTGANGAVGNTGAGGVYANGANGAAAAFNLAANTNDDFLFSLPGVASIGVTVTTNGAPADANRVGTLFNAVETPNLTGDECFRIDATAPALTAAYINAGNLFLVFNEPLALAGAGSNNVAANNTAVGAADGAFNTTTLANPNVENLDFQYIATPGPFTFADATPVSTAVLGNSALIAGNTVIQIPITTANNLAIGGQIRPLMMGLSGIGAAHDFVGNLAAQTSATAGVPITAPPAFVVSRVEWAQPKTVAGGALANAFRVVFSAPVSATVGTQAFYQGAAGNGQLGPNLRRGGAASDINFFNAGAAGPDPMNPNAVLVNIAAGAGTLVGNDLVWHDGRDTPGNQYTWTYNSGVGTVPQDIFGNNLGAAPANPFTVGDQIMPAQVGTPGWNDLAGGTANRDGKPDAIVIAYTEPVNTTAAAGTFALNKINTNPTVNPVAQIAADGTLTNDSTLFDTVTAANNVIPVTGVTVGNARLGAGVPARLQTGNAINIAFNPDAINWDGDAATAPGSTGEAIPGNGGPAFATVNSTASYTVTDTAGSVLTVPTFGLTNATTDFAPPFIVATWFLTGDNVETANQLLNEQDGVAGDQLANNQLVFVASEALAGVPVPAQVGFGVGGANPFGGGSFVGFGGASGNLATFANNTPATGNPLLVAGVQGSIRPGSAITDGAGNETTTGDVASIDRNAPYVPLVSDVNGVAAFSAFYTDANSNSFVDAIRLSFTQPINNATVAASDFSLSVGTITGVTVTGNDIVLAVTDGVIPVSAATRINYNGNTDAMRIASIAPGTGIAVSAVAPVPGDLNPTTTGVGQEDNSFNGQRIANPLLATQNVALMDIVGTVTTNGTAPVPAGTKVYAMLAVPTVNSITATHNNITFTADVNYLSNGANNAPGNLGVASMQSFTNWLLGVQPYVYLGRDDQNNQFYANFKNFFVPDADSAQPNQVTTAAFEDVINLTINAANLSSITFTGSGETTNDRVTGGRASLAWDVLRSAAGTIQSFHNGGYIHQLNGGVPILSSTVITGTDGRYELHMSAPAAIFDGLNRLNGIDRPIILFVELPNGDRFAASSLVTSVNGAPLLFRQQNRSQTTGQANNATEFNVNLANIGIAPIYSGWNLVPFNRKSGFANTAAGRPVLVDGVVTNDVVVPAAATPLPIGASPLEQWVYFVDTGGIPDGMFRRAESPNFNGVIIDSDYFPHFAFTMTSFGVQFGNSMTNLVGGYALGFFNPGNIYANLGAFQFGAPLTGNTLFNGASAATTFPNNATTQGWGLFTSKAAFNPATGIRGTANPDLDYLFLFRNLGPNGVNLNPPRTIDVSSLDLLAPTGTDNANDTTQIDAGQAFFGHFQP